MLLRALKTLIMAVAVILCLASGAGAANLNYLTNGDFSQGLTGWTAVVLEGDPYVYFDASNTSFSCLPSQSGNPYLTIGPDVPPPDIDPNWPPPGWSGKGYVEQQVALPADPAVLSLRTWGGVDWAAYIDLATATISLIDAAGTQHVLDAYAPPALMTWSGSAFVCSGLVPETSLYSLAAFAGQTVKLRLEADFSGFNGAWFDDVVITPGDYCRWLGGSGNWSNPAKWLANHPPMSTSWLVLQNGSDVSVDLPNAQIYTLTLDQGSSLTVQPGQGLTLNGPAVNNGTLTLSGDTVSYATGTALVQNGTLTIDPDVAMRGFDSGGGDFTFAQIGGSTQVNGTLDWGQGALTVQGGSFTVNAGGTVAMGRGASNCGFTQTGGSTTVNGTLAMRGFDGGGSDLALQDGSFSVGSDGTVQFMDIGSSSASSPAPPRPAALPAPPAGNVSLGGTLALTLASGYQPKVGDSFPLMTFGSRTGDFAQVTGANLGGGLCFQKVYSANSLTLVVAKANLAPALELLLD